MHSENEPIDLEGLHESVVDSDEDLADSIDVSLKPLSKLFWEFIFIAICRVWQFETL